MTGTKKKADKKTGLELLREPFKPNEIGKLPKPTKKQTDEVRANYMAGIRCQECGQWHHPKVVHLDYVGHAALTNRMLEADLEWDWQPLAKTEHGLPLIVNGELWINLTICGMTRLGVGDAQGKSGTNATKEQIGDALRNAGMRFGMALDLWHKGDLHISDDDSAPEAGNNPPQETTLWNGPLDKDALKEATGALLADLKTIGQEDGIPVLTDRMKAAEVIISQLKKDAPKWLAQVYNCVDLAKKDIEFRADEFPGDM